MSGEPRVNVPDRNEKSLRGIFLLPLRNRPILLLIMRSKPLVPEAAARAISIPATLAAFHGQMPIAPACRIKSPVPAFISHHRPWPLQRSYSQR
jgi:hypothetical protein